jgi:hypothetical protein
MKTTNHRCILRRSLTLAVLATLQGCSIPIYKLGIDACPTTTLATADKVTVQYLGVGGVLIAHGNDTVLTAPLYSNPSLIEFLMDHEVRTDTDLVDRLLPPEAARAKAIVVGHSHYDHFMDVAYVALHKAKGAKIYGSLTSKRLLAPIATDLAAQASGVVALDGKAHIPGVQEGQWEEVSPTIRLMAVLSEHSDQVVAEVPFGPRLALHLGRGKLQADATRLPRTMSEWAEGTVFSYVIDFLDAKGAPVFRVYYQDSGTNKPVGYLPAHVKSDGKAVDLAIICLGGAFSRLGDHPAGILVDTNPRFALLAHWEDFFVTQPAYCVNDASTRGDDRGIRGIPAAGVKLFGWWRQTDTERFMSMVDDTIRSKKLATEAWWLPCPTWSHFELPLAGDTTKLAPYKAKTCPNP